MKLKIADLIIEMRSRYSFNEFDHRIKNHFFIHRLDSFIYNGQRPPHIHIDVSISRHIPQLATARRLFTARFQEKENWSLYKRNGGLMYYYPCYGREKLFLLDKRFNRCRSYLMPRSNISNSKFSYFLWDVLNEFQPILAHYFAFAGKGIFVHAMGLKNKEGYGFIFVGPSGSGKSTMAEMWHRYNSASILSDEKIIVCRKREGVFIYPSPWHGAFSGDYSIMMKCSRAILRKIFFIYHSHKHIVRKMERREAFVKLYGNIFKAGLGKRCIENISILCSDLVKEIPCYELGFAKDINIVEFLRNKGLIYL